MSIKMFYKKPKWYQWRKRRYYRFILQTCQPKNVNPVIDDFELPKYSAIYGDRK